MRNTDWFLQSLYDFLPKIGVTVIQADFSRYVVDVNRSDANDTLIGRYNKAAIYTTDTWHDPILSDDITDLMIDDRMDNYYSPYHRALSQIILNTRDKFGCTHLFDLHSFLSSLTDPICLGSRNNQTAPALHPLTHNALSQDFYSIAENKVYHGGFITQKYGAMDNVEALQIELRYSEYLKEGTYDDDRIPEIEPLKFEYTKERLKRAFQEIIQAMPVKRLKTSYSLESHSAATSLARRAP